MTSSSAAVLRDARRRQFLVAVGLGDARREPLPGDASTRAYERLHLKGGGTLMLMDAPPAAESPPCGPGATQAQREAAGYNALARLAAGRVDAFAACAAYLRRRGLSAPEIVHLDVPAGFAVIEDLGDALFARLLEGGSTEPLYETAVDLLVTLHAEPPPDLLPVGNGKAWPLLAYDAVALQTGAGLFPDWWPKLMQGAAAGEASLDRWRALWAPIAEMGEKGATVFTHRDYHAENLLWLPGREGLARVGLLDFQDAVRAHPAWDLLSLLQDARREVPQSTEKAMLARYLAARPDLDGERFMADYASLAALNATRILGIFARLIVRDGKPRYGAFIPRMQRMLARNLAAPHLGDLRAWFETHAPMETDA